MQNLELLEAPLMRVPFEALKRAAKDRKSLLDEAQEALAASSGTAESLDALLEKLHSLKRKLAEVSRAEREEAGRCRHRLEHLRVLAEPRGDMIAWNKQRLDRLLVDFCHRSGFHTAAGLLAAESGIHELVDSPLFLATKHVVDALVSHHDCGPALAWAAANRAKLKKAKSTLELKLRIQEFIELVRREQRMDAVAYARTHLAPWAAQYMPEVQRAVATLVFPSHTRCPPYAQLFDEAQWSSLATMFLQELYRLHGLPPDPQLTVHLQAGLSALKTPASYLQGCSREDPLHLPSFQALADGLPMAKHVHSKLICSVTRGLMNDANPPVVLPNGYVYSQRAVELITARNGGRMVCPRTGASYSQDELRRAFIV